MRSLVLTCLALAASACSDPPVDDIVTRSLFVPPGGALDDLALVVPEGRALAFVAQPLNGDETLKVRITLEAVDGAVAKVEPTVELNQFVLDGLEPGSTFLTVTDEAGRTAAPRFTVQVVGP